jgi:hypothetical protein
VWEESDLHPYIASRAKLDCPIALWRRTVVVLITKLSTYQLDARGRRWTMHRSERWNQGQIGQLWTTLDSAPRAPQPQGAGAIPVPPAPCIPARRHHCAA